MMIFKQYKMIDKKEINIMKVNEFITDFQAKKIQNTKTNLNVVSEYIRKTLEIKEYISFKEKKTIAETLVAQHITEVDGVKKHDSINQYVSFIAIMLQTHTNLEISEDPIKDYDLLAESGLLSFIIEEFKPDYNECEILLKMALASELEDNNINMLVGKFLNNLLDKCDDIGKALKNKLENTDIKDILGANFKQEDLAKLSGFLNKYNKQFWRS